LIAVVVLLGGTPGVASASTQYVDPTPPWPQLLPPGPTTDQTQPGPVPGCARPTIACVEGEVRRMKALRQRLGCDHRAVFVTTYLIVTEVVLQTLRHDPHFFDDPNYLISEDALFADYYFRAFDTHAAGRPVPEAWRIAFETAGSGDANAGQDMLLGINAHVQRDQPFVLAQLGLRTPQGATRKRDHDRFNTLLERAYEPIVHEIARRYDPLIQTTNADSTQPTHNIAAWSWSPAGARGSGATRSGSRTPRRLRSAAWCPIRSRPTPRPGRGRSRVPRSSRATASSATPTAGRNSSRTTMFRRRRRLRRDEGRTRLASSRDAAACATASGHR
jgi:hypothetical protein